MSKTLTVRARLKIRACQICAAPFNPVNGQHKYCLSCIPDRAALLRFRKYRLTEPQMFLQLERQGYTCAICKTASIDRDSLYVDHRHGCCPPQHACPECRRGLLCCSCNILLGYVEQPGWLDKAALYLQRRS